MAEKHLIRIAQTDIVGSKNVLYGLTRIKGVGKMFSNALCKVTGVEPTKKIGTLSEADVKKITDTLADPIKAGIPRWMVNRQRDRDTGNNLHFNGTKLKLLVDDDIKRLKKIKCYRGIRHMFGLPSRGQRTRSNFRRNKGKTSLGVKTKGKTRGRV
ncbi:30S ribosomal protein S13 [Candidatus Woesearchaeota archaeon]|nr:30S ribosomal protein S13 [Candidatus Woesearchaeota archaeon]